MIRSAKPMRMWIDGKCFNMKQYKKLEKVAKNVANEEKSEITSTTINHDFTINPTDDGKMATTFRLPSIYYIRLTTGRYFNFKVFESDTNTQITIPKNGNDGYIIVTGSNEPDIVHAREVIQSVISEIREREVRQFLAIPVQTEEVQRNFEQFKNEILSDDSIRGMHETIFQSSLKLHLTIAVLALMDNPEKTEAIAALDDCKKEVIDPFVAENGPLKIKVAGIDCMNENFEKVNILYANAKIENDAQENVLQKLANSISDYFYERGLVAQYRENVKLHVTLINTKYRKSSAEPSPSKKYSKWQYKKQPFDARAIMTKYKDFYFGETIFDSVHLSNMSSLGDDGFYKPLAIINV